MEEGQLLRRQVEKAGIAHLGQCSRKTLEPLPVPKGDIKRSNFLYGQIVIGHTKDRDSNFLHRQIAIGQGGMVLNWKKRDEI